MTRPNPKPAGGVEPQRSMTKEEFLAHLAAAGTTVAEQTELARRAKRRPPVEGIDDAVLRFLPKDLLFLYEQVLLEEFGTHNLGASWAGDPNQLPKIGRGSGGLRATKSEQPEIRSVTRSRSANARKTVIRSERAMTERTRIDRKLKRIVREMKNFLASLDDPSFDAVPTQRRCSGKCKKFGDPEWLYCARCGGPMAEVD